MIQAQKQVRTQKQVQAQTVPAVRLQSCAERRGRPAAGGSEEAGGMQTPCAPPLSLSPSPASALSQDLSPALYPALYAECAQSPVSVLCALSSSPFSASTSSTCSPSPACSCVESSSSAEGMQVQASS
eukprot:CAMPEP_0173195426 /NCGR_PEP_ID=MMETSP1141-20130122/15046_1 /TAXON_ID=483371 /ORGANISM="non described non described, Strain CCMP2298" /LENGTH=127 /DNA_ID=CAMNT_0014119949 /DNA_START=122 /DNA_END=501 /DNA_ORIENTATION=+